MKNQKYEIKTHALRINPQFKKKKRDLKAESKEVEEKEQNEENKVFTLDELQDKIKRQPSLWRNEFNERLIKFKALFLKYREDPSREDETVVKYIKFMTHVCDVYKKDLEFLPTEFVDFLEQSYLVIHPNVRLEIVQALRMIRTKKLVTPTDILPVFFRLFRAKDKALRSYLFATIIGDLKIVNKKAKATNVNKTLQNFVFNMIKDPQEMAAKKSLQVMIELYKKKIWNDDNTVNVIAEAALQKSSKLCLIACKFFLLMNYDKEESSSSDSSDIDAVKSKIMNTRIGAKMSRKKKHNLEKSLKNMRRKRDRRGKIYFSTDFLPIDCIRCPQEYAEKLFYRLRKSNEKLEIKLYMMKLIARLIGRHKLIMFNFYPFIIKYINTHQKELAEFLAMIAESTHINVPHEEVSPLVSKILDHFVTERATPVNMTIALNALREILARNPNAMNKEQLQYCISYFKIKNKSVSMAIKSLVNICRDLRPDLLEKKQLGKEEAIRQRHDPSEAMVENTRLTTIDGIELLKEHEGLDPSVNLIGQRLLTEKDFKLIKLLKLKKMAEDANEELKLSLKGYDIIDERYKDDHDHGDCDSCEGDHEHEAEGDHEHEAEGEGEDIGEDGGEGESDEELGEFDADDENSESEEQEENNEEQKLGDKTKKKDKKETKETKEEGKEVVDEAEKLKNEIEEDFDIDFSDSSLEENPNPHNFLEGALLNTFKKSKYQKMAETYVTKEDKIKIKRERAREKHKKEGKSKTNKEKKKFKPMGMVMHKKLKGIQQGYKSTKERIKDLKNKMGKIRQGKLRVHRTHI